jgi:hypothetical protein
MNPDPQNNRDPAPPEPETAAPEAVQASHADEVVAPPPAVPRPLTRFVRLRALTEPRVRFWLLAAIVLAGIGIYFLANSFHMRAHEAWLIEHGVPVRATIYVAGETSVPRRKEARDSAVVLHFQWHGQEFESGASKLPGRQQMIETGSILPIHVNPDNPNDWTWLNEPFPIMNRAFGAIITFPLAALVMLYAFLRRAMLLRTWRDGQAVEALVVNARSTAVAPRCRAVEATPSDEKEKRVFIVYLPANQANIEAGDVLYIIRDGTRSTSAIAAGWFE